MPELQPMKDRVVFITGGNSGIGYETGLLFAAQGANVVVFSRRKKENIIAKSRFESFGVKCLAVQGDVTQEESVKNGLEETLKTFGRLDYAFNNAGIEQKPTYLFQQEQEDFQKIIDVNLKGVWLCMKYEIPLIAQSGGGAIVNHSSVSGIVASNMIAALAAAKHGVIGLTKAAALEYAEAKIRVNAICPAGVDTPMLSRITGNNPAARKEVDAYHPLGRSATAREIAEAVLWLCSPKSSFVTGHAMIIDGGASIR